MKLSLTLAGTVAASPLGGRLKLRFKPLFPFFEVGEAVEYTDLIVTAEGGLDNKSARGNIPAEIGRRGAAEGKAVIVLAGALGEHSGDVLDEGVCAYFSALGRPQSLKDAMRNVRSQLERVAEQVMRTFLAGVALGHPRTGVGQG